MVSGTPRTCAHTAEGAGGSVPPTPLTCSARGLDLAGCGRAPPSGGDQRAPLCLDESDYLTECEEGLPDGPQDTYADFQSSPAEGGSDSEDEPSLPQLPGLASPKPPQDAAPLAP